MTKTKISKVWHKSAEHFQEHQFWSFPPNYPGRPGERGLPLAFDAVLVSVRSICGGIDDSQAVELYDGTLGVSPDFVRRHEPPVGQLQWKEDLARHFSDPGDVAGKRWATGTLIGRDLFLAASHAFEQPAGRWRIPRRAGSNQPVSPEEAARHMQVNFNYQLAPNGQLRREDSYPVLELLEYRRAGLDYAIMRLGGHPGDLYGFAGISSQDAREGDLLCIIQHPEGQPKRVDAGPLFHRYADRIGYDSIDTLAGSSGAGILHASTGLLVGLHTNGGCDERAVGHNHGLAMSAIIRESPLVRELLRSGWQRQNLSLAAGAPQAKGDPVAGAGAVLFRGHHGSLQRLAKVAGYWECLNLTALTGAPPMRGNPAPLTEGDALLVFYRGRDRDIHLLRGGTAWAFFNLSRGADLPPAAEDPAVVRTAEGLSVAYLDPEGHLYEIRRRGDRWGRAGSPSLATGAPPARGGLTGLSLGNTYQWFYFDDRGDLHRLQWTGQWRHETLGGDAPRMLGRPAVWSTTEGLELVYRTRKGRLILRRERDGWRPADLMQQSDLPPAKGDPQVAAGAGATFLLYCDRDDLLHQLRVKGERWGHAEVSKEAGTGRVKGNPAGLELNGRLWVVFRSRDNQLLALGKADAQ